MMHMFLYSVWLLKDISVLYYEETLKNTLRNIDSFHNFKACLTIKLVQSLFFGLFDKALFEGHTIKASQEMMQAADGEVEHLAAFSIPDVR